MVTSESDVNCQMNELKAENERLRKQLAETRAQRAEYMKYISELVPRIELPSDEEMMEQMKNLIPADQVMRELNELLESSRQ